MSESEIRTYIITNTNTHLSGTQLGFMINGFVMAMKLFKKETK